MPDYGLIGKSLSHSFSKKFFEEKFENEKLADHHYHLFELADIEAISALAKQPNLVGFNITIPYKESILPYLSTIEDNAQAIGAVNVVKISNGLMHGYNTDYYGFRESLIRWAGECMKNIQGLILGTGGASKAVSAVLRDLEIPHVKVSRKSQNENILSYDELASSTLDRYKLIINTTPLGMSPQVGSKPHIPYEMLTKDHFLYDLVYNPPKTEFLKEGKSRGAQVKNGLEMLHLQAERSWLIWQDHLTI